MGITSREMEFDFDVSADKMTVAIAAVHSPEPDKTVTIEDVVMALAAHGVSRGVNRQVIKEQIEGKRAEEVPRVVVARGILPVPGQDAVISFFFDFFHVGAPEDEKASVDFKDRKFGVSVHRGQVLASKRLPVPGKPGTNVFGEVIQARSGADAALKAGRNVEKVEKPGCVDYVAETNGVLDNRRRDELIVDEKLTVDANVDLSTGNLECLFPITIPADVQSGFTVVGGSSIQICGNVDTGARVEAEGDIEIVGAAVGEKTLIISKSGSIKVGRIEFARVEAKSDITVRGYSIGAQIRCGGYLKVLGTDMKPEEKSVLAGGVNNAVRGIYAASAGSDTSDETHLIVGFDVKMDENERKLKAVRKELADEVLRLQRSIGMDLSTPEGMEEFRNMAPHRQKHIARLLQAVKTKSEFLRQIDEKMSALGKNKFDTTEGSSIRIQKLGLPVMNIRIGPVAPRFEEKTKVYNVEYVLDRETKTIRRR